MAEFENGKWERNLPYPLGDSEAPEYTENNSGAMSIVAPDFFPVDEPDTLVDIHVKMSMSQFTAIASSIDIGRDIGYGERSYEVWRTWCKALIGLITVNCEDVADCFESEIATNTTLQNAVATYINQSGVGNPNRINSAVSTILDRNPLNYQSEPVIEEFECNLDNLWGAIRHGIVQRLDDAGRDMLEDLNNVANVAQRVAVWLDIVPVLGDIAEALAFQAAAVIPDLLNLYNSYSSEATMDEIACDIFAMVCAECRMPTFEEIFNYYFTFGIAGMPDPKTTVLNDLMDALIDSANAVPKAAYFTCAYWYLMILNLNAAIAGNNGTAAIAQWAGLGIDFGNDNWLTLCNSCNELYMYYEIDLTKTNGMGYQVGGFTGSISSGAYIAGQGWKITAIDSTNGLMQVGFFLEDTSWVFIAVAYHTTSAVGAQVTQLRPTAGVATGAYQPNMNVTTGQWTEYANFLAAPRTGMREFAVRIADPMSDNTFLTKIGFKFMAGNAPSGSVPDANPNFS